MNNSIQKEVAAGAFLALLISYTFNFISCSSIRSPVRETVNFGENWKFHLGDIQNGQDPELNDMEWRLLNLPHDWSIEGEFNKDNPATPGGGALPGGMGWYRKSFTLPESAIDKIVFIDFDGVYKNSEVWINGHFLGLRPYGYSSFRYELTPYLKYGEEKNIIAVKVDNSKQPNSRWYSGSGIYRNVWLVTTGKIYVDHWGTFITTNKITKQFADISVQTRLWNVSGKEQKVKLKTAVFNKEGKEIKNSETESSIANNSAEEIIQNLKIENPSLWDTEHPDFYYAVTTINCNGKDYDDYKTVFGIRDFVFDSAKGFYLNGKNLKINGVCNHHDLGCLGAAVNKRAIERQLEILKQMGVNGIRTAHNPPAPELLDLCDEMGFIVMDEAFDMWKKGKTKFDYSLDWDQWHKKDLQDMILRDRNHPSVFIWSIGNEILEQWDTSGISITRELTSIVKDLDNTRPVTSNLNDPKPENYLYRSGSLDLVGFSYHQQDFAAFPRNFPGQKFIGSETVSALASRGHYDMPSDSIRRWPIRWDLPFEAGNPDNTCSSYDNCSAPWGSTHEETMEIVKKFDFISGQYIWTGFDYLGEPTPYSWPSRSSYFGVIDLAGFPKDAYYLYQSEWTKKPVLHVFPHWNWDKGDTIDVWSYTNCSEVELFLNGKSLGTKKKTNESLHLMWKVPYSPGTLKAVGSFMGKTILTKEVKTAGSPVKINLEADRNAISADGEDLSFVTVKILDKEGVMVPSADNKIDFQISGGGRIIGLDNGSQTNIESFNKKDSRNVFNGMCLVVIQSIKSSGKIFLNAKSGNLEEANITIETD